MINNSQDIMIESFLSISEASGDVDGKHIIAKVEGEFFVPNGISRNKRLYPAALWQKVINTPEVIKKMADRLMFGTVGHDQVIDDKSLGEGKISHVVTSLKIEGNKGLGTALIFDTPAGRVLNTLLRAGCKLFVSSRANGTYKGEENGIPVVDPDTYKLFGFDFVMDPGFLQARPALAESLREDLNTLNVNIESVTDHKENTMSQELLEKLAKENSQMKGDLEKALTSTERIANENVILADDNKTLHSKLEGFEKMKEELETYRKLGTPAEISSFMDESEKAIAAYAKIGPAKKIEEALDKAADNIEANNKFFKEFGSRTEIRKAFESAEKTLASYQELGTVSELSKVIESMSSTVTKLQSDKINTKIASLAKELKVSEGKIKSVFGKLPEAQIRELFKDVVVESKPVAPATKKVTEQYRKTATVNENKPATPAPEVKTARAVRFMESFVGPNRN